MALDVVVRSVSGERFTQEVESGRHKLLGDEPESGCLRSRPPWLSGLASECNQAANSYRGIPMNDGQTTTMSSMDIRPPCTQSTGREQGLLVTVGSGKDGGFTVRWD